MRSRPPASNAVGQGCQGLRGRDRQIEGIRLGPGRGIRLANWVGMQARSVLAALLLVGCGSNANVDSAVGTYTGTLTRQASSVCRAPLADVTTATFVVSPAAGGHMIGATLAGAAACALPAPGSDDLLDSIMAVPGGCVAAPAGFVFDSGFFDYGESPAQLTLHWKGASTTHACIVTDAWLLTRP